MKRDFVPFDDIRKLAADAVAASGPIPDRIDRVYLVRNLYGKVRVSVSDNVEGDGSCRAALQRLASKLHEMLGAHGVPAERGVLFVSPSLMNSVQGVAREVGPKVYLVDRLVTAGDWWTVEDSHPHGAAKLGQGRRGTQYHSGGSRVASSSERQARAGHGYGS